MKDNYAIFMKNSYQISEIILKNILGCISEDEKIQLQEWMNRSPENKQKYANWMQQLGREIHTNESIDIQRAWNKVQKRIQASEDTSVHSIPNYIRRISAAVVCLFILSGVSYYLWKQARNTPIVPGCEQAVLTDEKGNEIAITPESDMEQASSQSGLSHQAGNLTFILPSNKNGILCYNDIKISTLKKIPQEQYHTLNVPKGGQYQLVLSDGTYVYLNSASQIKFPPVFREKDSVRQVFIEGEAYLEVAHNDQMPFVVNTRNGKIHVLGTRFNVHDYPDEDCILVTLVEGKVCFVNNETEYTMRPGEEISYHKTEKFLNHYTKNTSSSIAWTTGLFEFDSMPLHQIMKQLSRWYDFTYEFEKEELKNLLFTGVAYRNSSVEGLLKQIEKTTEIKFEIDNRNIIIN